MENSEQAWPYDLAVIGLGYVGLPLAKEAARVGMRVLGIDVDGDKIATLHRGHSYVDDITDADVAEMLGAGFTPVATGDDLSGASAVVICVPTPLTDHMPDLSAVIAAAETVGDQLRPSQLVVLESTTYPGTTEEVLVPILEKHSGLTAGKDFSVAYSPERIDPGNREWGLANTPKIVGGLNPDSATRAESLYGKFCDRVVVLAGIREAEMAKLLENTYRHVNIALMNEMAIFCHELGIDLWEAIRGASSKPFGFQAFYPGPGVGGHCIPIDPAYLSYRVRQLGHQFRFVELAQEINSRMPAYVVNRCSEMLNASQKTVNGSRILLLGVTYKADVSDIREAPSLAVSRLLLQKGAVLSYSDPLVDQFVVDGRLVESAPDPVSAAAEVDLVVILSPHNVFDLAAICAAADLVLDTRGAAPAGMADPL